MTVMYTSPLGIICVAPCGIGKWTIERKNPRQRSVGKRLMEIKLRIPDQVYKEDRTYIRFFEAIQMMVNRMAVSHFKYGAIESNLSSVNELQNALQRVSMYDSKMLSRAKVWKGKTPKPLNTGNAENLLDAANFLIMEFLEPKHPKAHMRAQTSKESPGLSYMEATENRLARAGD
jgi:hypothetical protein